MTKKNKKKRIKPRDSNVIALWTTYFFKKIIENKKKKRIKLTKKDILNGKY